VTRRVVDVAELLRGVCPVLDRVLPASIRLQLNLPPERLAVLADSALIQQLVANLVINARDAMPDGGWVVVAARRTSGREAKGRHGPQGRSGCWIEITIADCGSGMSAEVQGRAFEPFFTTKAHGVGTGLGLSQAASIVRQHNGHIELDSRLDWGTSIRVYLPECDQRPLTVPVLQP
jgi:signal transduction histidine kinase